LPIFRLADAEDQPLPFSRRPDFPLSSPNPTNRNANPENRAMAAVGPQCRMEQRSSSSGAEAIASTCMLPPFGGRYRGDWPMDRRPAMLAHLNGWLRYHPSPRAMPP